MSDNEKVIRDQSRHVRRKRCIPLISNFVMLAHLCQRTTTNTLYNDNFLVREWAEQVRYPMQDDHSLARVAQYHTITKYQGDEVQAKEDFLDFLKRRLLQSAESTLSSAKREAISAEMSNLTVSDTALRLGLLQMPNNEQAALNLLAQMEFPIYLTTTPFTLLEDALRANGKEDFVVDYYRWSEMIPEGEGIPRGYNPTPERPLIYHLHGLDSLPESLVLTEDNFFEFFEQLSQDLRNENQGENRLPPLIRKALARYSIILLGYDLYNWAFRFFFRGPFREAIRNDRKRIRNVSAQFPPTKTHKNRDRIHNYLTQFFAPHQFDVYWGSVDQFTQALWQELVQ